MERYAYPLTNILLASAVAGNFLRIGIPFLPTRSIPLSLLDLVASLYGLAAILWLLSRLFYGPIGAPRAMRLFVAWLIIGLMSLIIVGFLDTNLRIPQFMYSSLYGYRFASFVFIALFLVNCSLPTRSARQLTMTFVYSCSTLAMMGVVLYIIFPNLTEMWAFLRSLNIYFPNPDPHVRRVVSTFFDPNFLATFLILPILYLVNAVVSGLRNKQLTMLYYILLCIVTSAFLLSFSRSGFIGLTISLSAYFVLGYLLPTRRYRTYLRKCILLVSMTAVFFLILDNVIFDGYAIERILERFAWLSIFGSTESFVASLDPSAAARINSWRTGLMIFSSHPLIGVGFNNYGNILLSMGLPTGEATMFGNDSSWLLVLATTGTIGFILYAVGYFMLIRDMFVIYKAPYGDDEMRGMALCFGSFLVGIAISSFFNNLLFYPAILLEIFINYALLMKGFYQAAGR